MLSIFSYLYWPSECLLWRSVYSDHLPIFKIGLLFFLVWSCVRSLCILAIKPLSEVSLANIFFPYNWFPFHFADFFSHAETFYFHEVPFVYSFLCVPCSRGHIGENIAAWNMRFSCLPSPLGLLWYHNLYLSLLSILILVTYMV